MSLAIESFIENVQHYLKWVDQPPHSLSSARQLLLSLMQGIPYLITNKKLKKPNSDAARLDHETWKHKHKSLSDFPVQYYQQFFSPLSIEHGNPVVGDAHDDLADIYGELWHGMEAFRADDTIYAIMHWRDSYFDHWGHHAAAAIYAIDEHYRQSREIGEHLYVLRSQAVRTGPAVKLCRFFSRGDFPRNRTASASLVYGWRVGITWIWVA